MKRLFVLWAGLIPALLLGVLNCKKPESVKGSYEVSPQVARLIREVTSGPISPHQEITIQFLVPFDETGLEKQLLSFNPSIEGELIRKDRHTLVFQPEQPLPLRQTFVAVLALDPLFPEVEERPGSFTFTFETAGREVSSLEGDFHMLRPGDPHNLYYQGRLELTEPAELAAVKKALSFSEGGDKIPLEWQKEGDGRLFSFKSERIQRDERQHSFLLAVEQEPLKLSEPFEREIVLQPLTAFSLAQVVPRTEGASPGFTLVFSDELDTAQDLSGLIRLEPQVDIRTSVAGKRVMVSGEFEFGSSYTLILSRGIRSRWGTSNEEEIRRQVELEDIKPRMVFLHEGVFLPSRGKGKVYFRTVNLRRVRLEVKKVFENNLGQFLQTERLASGRDRNRAFNDGYVRRVGIRVAEEILEIGEERNLWLNHELDLSSMLDPDEKGTLLISLSFKHEDMVYRISERRYGYRGDEYYSNPSSWGYIRAHGRIYKPLIISDIGLTWKKGGSQHRVFATNLMDTGPLEGALVELRSYQNQLLASGRTDRAGQVLFDGVEGEVFYVTAEKDGQRSVLKANEMGWSLASFDTEGEEVGPEGTRAFFFTERGVHRPGDEVYLSAIFRNPDDTFPDHHPVSLKLTNPRGQMVHEEINTEGIDGFYQFRLSTRESDPTGIWIAELQAGSARFAKEIRIETIVPFRLKVNLRPEKKELDYRDRELACLIESSYLFGAPAAGLEASLSYRLAHRELHVSRFPGYFFSNQAVDYQELRETPFEGRLDTEGKAKVRFVLPPFEAAPSALDLHLTAATTERGGREVTRQEIVTVDPYPYYVGIRPPEMEYGYLQVGSSHSLSVVVVDRSGRSISGRPLTYSVYRNIHYWWWEYDSYDEFHLRYKSDAQTERIAQGNLTSRTEPVPLQITPESWGEYLVEVEDEAGHRAGFFFRASIWGRGSGGEDAGLLALKADKEVYHPGEDAVISLPSSSQGNLLVTVEKADRILSAEWYKPEEKLTRLSIPVTMEMLPTAYVTVSYLQPYDQKANDRPLRMYGIVPLNVEEAETRQEIDIMTADRFLPNEKFTVGLQTRDRKPTRYVLAVVDEGLLDLTGFETPDPWQGFYRKLRLAVSTFDLFGQVIGAHKGDVFRTFSIGGAEGLLRVDAEKAREQKRFEPVVFVTEPAMTDERGRAEVSFTMPNYMGSVRIMVMTATGSRYGRAEATVPVRSDLVLLPTLPRVLGPDEELEVPVTLFAMNEALRQARVIMETEGPVEVVGSSSREVIFGAGRREQDMSFQLRTRPAVGKASITLRAEGGGAKAFSSTSIEIRASSPPLYRTERAGAAPGETLSFFIPADGMPGTNKAHITISPWGNLNLNHRLNWLVRYPYGCIEQVVSAAFPQLYLRDIVQTNNGDSADIDRNINAGIEALRRFQLPSGGFSYWPGLEQPSPWGSNYAGHFLLEAERLGYPVPADLKEGWIQFQHSRSLTYQDSLMSQVYRLYLLALAGRPAVGPMNFIVENSLQELDDTERWILAAAYSLAGLRQASERILSRTSTKVGFYVEYGGTYGSTLRDQAMILDMSNLLGRRRVAEDMYEVVAEKISSEDWYSTQSLGYGLLALGKYLKRGRAVEPPRIVGRIVLPGGREVPFFLQEESLTYELEEGLGRRVSVFIDRDTNLEHTFLLLEWEGVPLKAEEEVESNRLSLRVSWYSAGGMEMDARDLRQGSEFWGHFRVAKTAASGIDMEELVLTQILPSGWEIENIRLTGEPVPNWAEHFNLGREEYADFRDDRISWFFDLARRDRQIDFLVKLRAVTAGSFHLPPTVCEAMYRRDTRAVQPGGPVRVRSHW